MWADRVWWMPPNGALHGIAIDRLMWWNLVALTALFLLAHVFLLAAMFRRKRASSENSGFSRKHELIPLALLTLIYAWMAVSAQQLWARIRYQGAAPRALQVEVTGEQFQWYFRYPGPDGKFGATKPQLQDPSGGGEAALGLDPADPASKDDIVAGTMYVPVNREIEVILRAEDVIHSFFVPAMRFKQDAVPGIAIHMHFTPITTGDYEIACSQLCGLGHYKMHGILRVVSQEEFDKWLAVREAEKQ